jgi:hypothetical protein
MLGSQTGIHEIVWYRISDTANFLNSVLHGIVAPEC